MPTTDTPAPFRDSRSPGAHIRRTDTPARYVPLAMWVDVSDVLEAHGLTCRALDVVLAVEQLVRQTPVEQGGRLRADGTVDES